MGHQSAGIDFALIGHQDSWDKIMQYVHRLRVVDTDRPLTLGEVKDIFSYIPPRVLFDIAVSAPGGKIVHGVYIETFISPDELSAAYLHKNLQKVKEACEVAADLRAGIAALGGFTSIVLETGNQSFEKIGETCFTTGNTLTAAFILAGIEKACYEKGKLLRDSHVLVIGSTGDIGSACVQSLINRVDTLNLCARMTGPLRKQAEWVTAAGQRAAFDTDVNRFLPDTDILIAVASSILEKADISLIPAHAIICDAGYPKNISAVTDKSRVFFGGMGRVTGGFDFIPDYKEIIYGFPSPDIGHGCLLEAIVLAMAGKPSAFSKGRGKITPENIQYISRLAGQQGIILAPLFNSHLVWQ